MSGTERWRTVLTKASRALGGREVAVWTADGRGGIRPLATSSGRMPPSLAALALGANLRRWKIAPLPGKSWVALHGADGRWYVAPVRVALPAPPPLRPSGAERRSQERLTLELVGLCVGVLETRAGVVDPDPTRLAAMVEQRSGLLWIADRALRVSSCTGPGLSSPDVPAECGLGVSLVTEFERGAVTAQSFEAHKRALRGQSAAFAIRVGARSYDAQVEPLRDGSGAVVGVMGVARDATDRERALEAARRAEEELEAVLQHAPVPIHWIAPDGTILRANAAALELLGVGPEEFIGRNIARFHEDPRGIQEALRRVAGGADIRNLAVQLRRKDGSLRRVRIALSGRFANGRLAAVRVMTRDVTERKSMERSPTPGTLHDGLTDLPTRAYFTELLVLALERARRDLDYRFAVLVLDVDQFQAVNTRLGRATGDRLLREIATRLRRAMRPGDVVARLGDDEFIVLLEDLIGAQAVERAARRLGAQLAGAYIVDDRTLRTSVSMSAVIDTAAYERPEDLLADAVVALAHAKTEGRGRFRLFDVTMRSSPAAHTGLEVDLARALERDELRLVFDPIVSLATGRLHAFEALLRWHHPSRGVLRPLEFLPSAERTGAIVPIDRWVLQQACREARRWGEVAGHAPVRVTVNVSGKQLAERGFVTDVRDAVRDAGLEPGVLGVEIPERVLTADVKSTTAILTELRRLKVQVHLDDFGTGCASLPRLPRLPLDWIKVDRSCVHRLGARRTDLEVVRSIVEQSKELGLGVIAEGVETGAQRARLMAFGCELGQGFRFAEPVSSSEAAGLLAEAGQRLTT